jgi:hypothetical protein
VKYSAEKRKKKSENIFFRRKTTFPAEDDISGGNVVFRRPQGAVVGDSQHNVI